MGAARAWTSMRRRSVPWLVLGLWVVVLALASPFAAGH
ncbi:MMPL family transporter OS=Streptomyces alboniger OX=132473 GN=CP975_11390 PE=3 SV=1 [Streptomyces alboniger]